MQAKYLCIALFLFLAAWLAAAPAITYDYDNAWQEVTKLQNDGLPLSMQTGVDEIYKQARTDKIVDQQVKALIYKLIILQSREEFSNQKAIDTLQVYIRQSSFPATAILHSMLAQLYWSYYTSNRWQFSQRSETINFDPKDIATWDLKTISKATLEEYQLSLENPAGLQGLMIDNYPAIVKFGNDITHPKDTAKKPQMLRPTLYDFLAFRALDFYTNDESGLTMPFEEFTLTDTKYFQPAASFIKMQINSPDSLSLKYKSLLLLQDLIRFHRDDRDPSALVVTDLRRLEYAYANFALPEPEKLYEPALRLEMELYKDYPISTYAIYKLAKLTYDLGGKYKPDISEDYRWNYKDALQICETGYAKFTGSYGAACCKSLAGQIRDKSVTLIAEQAVLPSAPIKVLLTSKNLEEVKIRIYHISQDDVEKDLYGYKYSHYNDGYEKLKRLLLTPPIREETYPITLEGDYRSHSYELALQGLPAGNYVAVAYNYYGDEGDILFAGYYYFNVTNLSFVQVNGLSDTIMIAERDSGKPVSAVVKLYEQTWDETKRNHIYKLSWYDVTNTKGVIQLPVPAGYNSKRMVIYKGADTLYVSNYYIYKHDKYWQGSSYQTLLFTDRAIYRPGQAIFMKGVMFAAKGDKTREIVPNSQVYLTFYDVNHQVVEKQTVQTNEYGTFNATFTAPQGVLTGNMSIYTNYGSVSFSVEEYKRPRFEVTIDKPQETYKLNQYVNVTGKALAYAGFPIDNAQVSYRIVRQPRYPFWFWWWGPQPSYSDKEILNGTIQTDAKGEFKLTFLAQGDSSVPGFGNPYFIFKVTADVTDIGGETRSGSLSLSIGEMELLLNPNVPDKVNQDAKTLTVPVVTTNLNGVSIPVTGTVKISRLQSPDHIMKSRLWNAPDRNYLEREDFLKLFPKGIYDKEDKITAWKVKETVFRGRFSTPETDSLFISDLAVWEPGVYVLEAVSSYKQQEVTAKRYFTVYSAKASRMPYPMADWYVPVKVFCEPGETASLLIGTSYSNTRVIYQVEKDHAIIDSLQFTLDNEQKLLTIPVKESDRGGFFVHLVFIRDGRVYIHNQQITVPWTNKKIDFEYMTFRDKLLPGQEEEWRLKLKDYTGGKLTAEVLASMYDASLDAFRSSAWSTNIYGQTSQSYAWNSGRFISNTYFRLMTDSWVYSSLPSPIYNELNWYGYNLSYYGGRGAPFYYMKDMVGSERSINLESIKVSAGEVSDVDGVVALQSGANVVGGELHIKDGSGGQEEEPAEDLSGVQARTNFAETAFFYPDLRTDENGEVSFVFTVPEALTRWKFRALALTRDLKIGTTENTTVTQKPMMVMPNAPRFFREGDKITFSSKITSLDETDQSGNCQLFLFDAITMQPVEKDFKLIKAQQPFAVKKGESTVLNWELTIPFGLSAVTYRIVARAGDFSDGEENTLPILTNRMLVTESLPLPVRGKTTRSFTFEKLKNSNKSSTLKNFKLTLEYTSNPAWYAVQALPYLMEYPYECNEQVFARFYANSIASHIANFNPKIKRVFDSWKNTPNSTALLSNLEKNQELKSLLLQETPWVLDAKNESQAKQRIGLLFDLNNMANQFNSALTKLQQNQNSSGAWPWFPGMKDSWWVTQYIVEGFGHLDHLGVTAIRQDNRIWNMAQKAVNYLDRQILKDYQEILKYSDPELDHLGYMEMYYLYTRSFFNDLKIPDDVKVAVEYFKDQADKYWLHKAIYGQGLIALGLYRFDKTVTPNKIIASLRERALHDEEMGMWWKNDAWGWFWYQAPIETQSLLIEAFNDVAKDVDAVDELRTWLLKNKQTTNWKTTKATAEACYALLISGTEWLNDSRLAEITLGGKEINPNELEDTQVEAGTGYFKTSWSGSDITPAMADVTITNPNDVSSWGALYWQYFENLDKITPAETPLKLKKQLFIERITDTGKVIEPVSDRAKLNIGDKVIVRIELRTDRDMEYVHMKDMRAAGFEPINVLSRSKWQDGLWYYEATGDAATNFFIEYLHKGTYVFEYPLRVFNKGDFSNGVTTIQCMYAPEFTSHSEGIRVEVR